jgi:hypothetical protein
MFLLLFHLKLGKLHLQLIGQSDCSFRTPIAFLFQIEQFFLISNPISESPKKPSLPKEIRFQLSFLLSDSIQLTFENKLDVELTLVLPFRPELLHVAWILLSENGPIQLLLSRLGWWW